MKHIQTNNAVKSKSKLWCHLGALLAVTAWGMSFVSTKVLLDAGLSTVEAYLYRFIIAYLILLLMFHKNIRSNSIADETLFALCGMLSGSIYFILENTGLEYTLVTNVSLLTSTSPLITTILVGAIYKGERITGGTLLGSLIALIGVACVIFNASFNLEVNPLGDMLALLAAVCWAIYSIVLRRLTSHYDVWFITRKTFFYGVLTALPFLLMEPRFAGWEVLAQPAVWGNITFLALYASLIGYVLWAQANKGLGSVKAGNYMYFQPIITLIASAVLINETITIVGTTGCLLIIFGVWLGDYLTRRQASR